MFTMYVVYCWRHAEKMSTEERNIDTHHILVSGPILYFRVMTTV